MFDAGLFGLLAPKAYGGHELPITDVMRVWEAVTRVDSAAGWNLVMNQGIACFAAWLPEERAQELLTDGPTTAAGGFFPPGTGERVDGGWKVTARQPFVSGCHNAHWIWIPALEAEGGEPVLDPDSGQPTAYGFFVPQEDIKIFDTWHTMGMRGTGSADVAVTDQFVPDRRVLPIGPLEHQALVSRGRSTGCFHCQLFWARPRCPSV